MSAAPSCRRAAAHPLLLLLLLARATPARGWSLGLNNDTADIEDPGSNGTGMIWRWSLDVNGTHDSTAAVLGSRRGTGLSGGISWSLDPRVCEMLLPLIAEEVQLHEQTQLPMPTLVDCDLVRRMVRRAMSAWEAANQNVRFFEVTSMCDPNRTYYVAPPPPPPSAPPALNATPAAPPSPPVTPPAPPSAPPHYAWLPPFSPPPTGPPPPLAPPEPPGPPCPPRAPPDAPPPLEPPPPNAPPLPPFCDVTSESCFECEHAEMVVGFFVDGADDAPAGRVRLQAEYESSRQSPRVSVGSYLKGSWLLGDHTTGIWEAGFPPTDETLGHAIGRAELQINLHEARCFWVDEGWCVLFHRLFAEDGVDVKLMVDAICWGGMLLGALLVVYLGGFELYAVLQTTLLSWDTDGDGVVELHEVVAALRDMCAILGERLRKRKGGANKKGFGGRTIEWRAAAFGLLDVVSKIDLLMWCLTIVLLTLPSAFRSSVFQPCWQCDDLATVLSQQLGNTLGLSPDPTPAVAYKTDREVGYNCTHPTLGLTRATAWDLANSLPASIMRQPTLRPYPRFTCPTDDDQDGLRFLYPECDVQLECELPNASSACLVYSGAYNCEDAFGCSDDGDGSSDAGADADAGAEQTSDVSSRSRRRLSEDGSSSGANNASNASGADGPIWSTRSSAWSRPLASPRGVDFGEHESSAAFRALLLLVDCLLVPIAALAVAKCAGKLLLLAPCLAEVKQRSRKLQFTAQVRKAEVRRMGQAGQQFMVKQTAKQAGIDSSTACDAFKTYAESTTPGGAQGAALLKATARQTLMAAALKSKPAPPAKPNLLAAVKFVEGGDTGAGKGGAAEGGKSTRTAKLEGEVVHLRAEIEARAAKLGESAEPVGAMVARGVASARGGSKSPVKSPFKSPNNARIAPVGADPAAAGVTPSKSFGEELRQLTASLEQRTAAAEAAQKPAQEL